MREFIDLLKIKKSRNPLDRVEGPEDGIYMFLVVWGLFQADNIQFDCLEVFHGLGDKVTVNLSVLGHVECRF